MVKGLSVEITEFKKESFKKERGEEGNGTPLQYCCPENPMDEGAW